jgi:hypothetical protein
MLNFNLVMPEEARFKEVTQQCEKSYWRCDLLDEKSSFNENPDYYCIVRRNGNILATLGVFLKTSTKSLPIDGVMWYQNSGHGQTEIELGRLSFHRKPSTKKEVLEVVSITRFLLENFYFHAEEKYGSYMVFFETYKTIIKLLAAAIGKDFMIPRKCLLRWERIPEERLVFYRKFSEGTAGLYQVDLDAFRKAIGLVDEISVCA